jgi:cyclic pyranopterin phosphate synthase
MVDITDKPETDRCAVAQTRIQLPLILKSYLKGEDLVLKKGPVIQTAIIAGTMAVKKTADLIPFCHSLPIHSCKFHVHIDDNFCINLQCEVKTNYKTGVEMEALCGVSVAALTIYDMCKAIAPNIIINDTRLLEKTGGKSSFPKIPLYGLVLTGGKSERMQTDKALIDYYGQPHGQYLYEILTPYCEQVFISARDRQWENTVLANLPTLIDQEEGLGPLGGILTALTSYPEVNWLIVACDLAYFHPEMIDKLLSNYRQDVVATCYQNGDHGFPEALCGIYTPLALKLFQRAKKAKIHCPVKILQMADCNLITADRPTDIANINTPIEYEQVKLKNCND